MKKIIALVVLLATATAWTAAAGDIHALYEKSCQKCHGADGKGLTKMGRKLGAKDYTDPKVQAQLADEKGIKAVKEGLKSDKGEELMKPASDISDEDAKALIAFMRTFKQ